MKDRMHIGGLTPLTSTDYPGALAAVVFCQGCPWRCSYCHNPHLIHRHRADGAANDGGDGQGENPLEWSGVVDFLRRRQGLLDAVVFSGGEPTLQDGLREAIAEVCDLGFKVGLHTGGTYPTRLTELLPLLSWVGMDIKTDFEDYEHVTGAPNSGEKALESARLLLESGVAHEFRTTVHPLYHTPESLLQLAGELSRLGVRHYVLQEFRPLGCSNRVASLHSAAELLDEALCRQIEPLFESFSVRRA